MNIQRTLLVKLWQDNNTDKIMELDQKKFTGENLRILRFFKDFIADNSGKLPTSKIMRRHFDNITDDLKRPVNEPIRYLMDEVDNAHTHNSLVDLVTNITKDLKKKGEISPKEVLKKAEKILIEVRSEVVSERKKGVDVTQRRDHISKKLKGRRTSGGILGYHLMHPSLTKLLRGLRKKRLYTLVARTSVGKTVFSFLLAMYIWQQYNTPVLFLSGELDEEQLEDMYLSFLTGISVDKIENGDLSDEEVRTIDEKLKEVEKKAPFIFGFASSYADIVTELNTHMPSVLFVDSFYELDRFDEPDDTRRTSVNISRLQRLSREYSIPVVVNSQLNRETDKKKGADMRNISFSDTIPQTSDVVLALNQPEEMRMAKEMEVSILKNRGGRLAKVLINWNFSDNDFSEIRAVSEHETEAQDTSELTNADVEKENNFDKLLGRDKKKSSNWRIEAEKNKEKKKKPIKKKKKVDGTPPWDTEEETKPKRKLPRKKVA